MSAEPRTLKTEAEQGLAAQFRSALPGLPGGGEARARREAAFALFEKAGLPHRRVEAWKYTDLRAVMRQAAPLAKPAGGAVPVPSLWPGASADEAAGPAFWPARLIVLDGTYRPDLSDLAGLDGITVAGLADTLRDEPGRVGRLFGDDLDPLLALNSALMAGGVVVTVPDRAEPPRPVEIAHVSAATAPAAFFVRNLFEVGTGARLRLVESHAGNAGVAYQANVVTELALAEGARVTAATVQREGDAALSVRSLVARLGDRAELDHLLLTAGGAVSRFQAFLQLGHGSRLGASGATLLSGDAHADIALVIDHVAPAATSRVLYKNMVDGESFGAFQGLIVVRPGAQKTDGRMMSRAIHLSDRAEFAAKPELEIYADDVQCGHGATSGRIDEDMLFYFLARGIPRSEAERLLLTAFLAEAVEALGDAEIGGALMPGIDAWLAHRALAGRKAGS